MSEEQIHLIQHLIRLEIENTFNRGRETWEIENEMDSIIQQLKTLKHGYENTSDTHE